MPNVMSSFVEDHAPDAGAPGRETALRRHGRPAAIGCSGWARLPTILGVAVALSGCVTGGPGRASLAPASEGVVALGDGLIGQTRIRLSGDARAKALEAEFQALQFGPAGQEVAWTADGFQGSVVPTQLYRIGSQDCRGYSHTLLVKGQPTKQIGTACRGEDGFWTTVV